MHINMKKEKKYIEYILKQAEALLAIDSPSGFTEKVTDYLCEEYKRLGYKPVKTKKGGVLVEIGGKGNAILTMAVFAHLCKNFVGVHPNVALSATSSYLG